MGQILSLLAGLITWLINRVGFRVAYLSTILAAMFTIYLAGWAVLYLAFKALIATASSFIGIPSIAAMASYFFPSTSALTLSMSICIGSNVIAANFRAWFFV